MNILIYDELPLFIHGIRCRWAELAPALHITAAHSEDEVWKGLIKNRADIIILDADYEIEKKIALLTQLTSQADHVFVLMNFSRLDNVNPICFLENGAAGILTKKMESEELLQAIEWVRQGRIYLPDSCLREHKLIRMHNSPPPLRTLSPRQREILHLVVQGHSNKQICRVLGIAEGTVKNHLHALFRQLGVRNRTEAAMILAQTPV
ncbi:response regulator transcription factor [Enterobacter kobei]|jgi:DNA-binding NarL/FixJ family response regulator|nr:MULTISPECIES: response regulator transcription factor [Enterobacter]EMC7915720.1 response regulator transcription factor [Enterobacter kobei]ESN19505.1 LuxR family transcriptional regulator [Enterobacter sp. MGH 22]KDF41538.1 hypothetical protein AE42_03965 [Enterobacter kobei]KLG28147.1 LuxR family transcriptional regulator [Enterobacter kobei]KLR32401.1 LuxR family transcriptional regulator [Enterobacter kobei]